MDALADETRSAPSAPGLLAETIFTAPNSSGSTVRKASKPGESVTPLGAELALPPLVIAACVTATAVAARLATRQEQNPVDREQQRVTGQEDARAANRSASRPIGAARTM